MWALIQTRKCGYNTVNKKQYRKKRGRLILYYITKKQESNAQMIGKRDLKEKKR